MASIDPADALRAAASFTPRKSDARLPVMTVAGAAGTLGNEVLHRLAAVPRNSRVQVLVNAPMLAGLRGVHPLEVPAGSPDEWPPVAADEAVVLFEPPRSINGRERVLWTPEPAQLLPLARWLRRCGVQTLAVVFPHEQGRLPDALRRGLANLDEHALTTLGFARLLIVRSARLPTGLPPAASAPEKLANSMLSIFKYMVPAGDKPLMPARLSEVIEAALAVAPPGVHVIAPELLWDAARGDARAVLAAAWQGNGPRSAAESA